MKKEEIFFSGLLSILTYLLGGIDSLIISLIVIILIDYVTGIIKAIYEKNFSNVIHIKGILKKIGYLVIVSLAVRLDTVIGNDSIALRSLVIYFFIANESISIIDNWNSIGLPLPKKFCGIIKKFKDENN